MATITEKLDKLNDLKTTLATNLNTKGVSSATPSMTYNELVPKVLDIITGTSTITDATAVAGDILDGKVAYNNSGKITGSIPSIAAATYTPSTSTQTIKSGNYLSGDQTISGDENLVSKNIKAGTSIFGVEGTLETVDTSDATATEKDILLNTTAYGSDGNKITGTIPSLKATTYTPTITDQTISAGQYLQGVQTIKGDMNLSYNNIKSGITIFGVTGSSTVIDTATTTGAAATDIAKGKTAFVNGVTITGTATSGTGIDTSDATATASDILLDKTAYANGEKITGTIKSLSATTYTPSAKDQEIAASQYLSGIQTIKGDANLIASNIKKGVTIFGIEGTLDGGTSQTSEQIIYDSRSMTSKDEVVTAYESVMYGKDSADDAAWTALASTEDYRGVGVYTSNNHYGANFLSSSTPVGYYFTTPVTITSTDVLLETTYFASTWTNPTMTLYLISADSTDEIQTKIANAEYAYNISFTWTTTENNTVKLIKMENTSAGTYYPYLVCTGANSGNEALLLMLGFICL